MQVISPKWIYSNNTKLEVDKSILIDGSIIIDILDNKTVEKQYKEISRIEYPNHLLMPTFTESYLDLNDCGNKKEEEEKIKSLLKYGVTKLCVNTNNYKDIIYSTIDQIDIALTIQFDGKTTGQLNIKEMTDVLDFYKSDPSKIFCITLENIIHFQKDIIKKLSSIINEIDINVHIKGNCLENISDKKIIKEIISFWTEINLIDNSYMHGLLKLNDYWLSSIKKRNVAAIVAYDELRSIDNYMKFYQLLKNKYKCILVTDSSDTYDLYQSIKLIETIDIDKHNFDKNGIIDCVTKNPSELFSSFIPSGEIKKGNKASFNLFDFSSHQLLKSKISTPKLRFLDKQSLTHVWSAGKKVKI
tara:strand:- start:440 stop:1513 length:1074 start_codon:yes stop_codon:yes gene_type:complete